jgi:hypothetical protein
LIEETFSTSKLYFKAPINLEMIINEVRFGVIRKGYIQWSYVILIRLR